MMIARCIESDIIMYGSIIAKTEMDEYKINILGERIGMGDSMMMKDIHCWCTRQI